MSTPTPVVALAARRLARCAPERLDPPDRAAAVPVRLDRYRRRRRTSLLSCDCSPPLPPAA